MPTNYRKRRVAHGPSKNELRAARKEQLALEKTRAGTLRQRFPQVNRLQLDFRLETPMGAVLDHVRRDVGLDEPLLLNVSCPSACGGGHFLLTEAVENLIATSTETREGMGLCEAASYADPRSPCGTKLYYKITLHYK
jgi:hypothetical protein